MFKARALIPFFLLLGTTVAVADRRAVLEHYSATAENAPSAERGRMLWNKPGIRGRDCTQCHGNDLRQAGRHRRTRKPIDPMAPSVNPKRFTDPRKVEKWFRRNCKWTWGRECTAQEKADILQWLNTL